jgi:hypothetical protein
MLHKNSKRFPPKDNAAEDNVNIDLQKTQPNKSTHCSHGAIYSSERLGYIET